MKKSLRQVLVSFPMVFILLVLPLIARADYVYEGTVRMPLPATFVPTQVIDSFGEMPLNDPTDLFIGENGNLYIVDKGNNRIVVIGNDEIRTVDNAGEKGFSSPEGIFVDEDGDLYVADTGNGRIVHLTGTGEFIEEFVRPTSELLSEDFQFQPVKVAINQNGMIYTLNKTRYQGFFTMDAMNNFKGYTGGTKVGYSFFDVLLRMFGSDFQKNMTAKRLPAPATNLCLSGGDIYATISPYEGKPTAVARYNAVGVDLMPRGAVYGEATDDFGRESASNFADIAVDSMGIISVVDSANCRVYQMDADANVLCVFGSKGNNKGMFQRPVSIACDAKRRLYVLDSIKGNIQIFEPTPFITDVHMAVSYYYNGEYDLSREKWEAVLEKDESYFFAHQGIVRSLYKNGDYKQAMERSEYIGDRELYSLAFDKYAHDVFRRWFVPIVIGILVFLPLMIWGISRLKKATDRYFGIRRESK